jgi:EmrB/QacA subfamily drug resistance transporter
VTATVQREEPTLGPITPHLPLSRRRRMGVTAGIMVGMFLAALEATVVTTAMPTVVAKLGGIERYSWVFSAYLLTSTVTVPLWGRLSDLYGRKRLYQIGIGLFLVGSVLCGFSGSMWQLIGARAVQGLGAGALVPLALTIIGEIYTLQERARMQGFFSGVWGIASIIGPLLGGFITDTLSWEWVFWINLPVGLVAAAIIGYSLEEPRRTERPVVDYAGAATLMISITLLLFGLVEGGQLWGWSSPATVATFAAAAATLGLFLWIETRTVAPMVPLDLFRDRTFTTTTIVGFFVGTAMFGATSFIPLFIQGVTGASATVAGSALSPLLLAWVLTSVVGGRIMHRVGMRRMVVVGVALLTIGFFLLTRFGRGASITLLMADMALMGVGMGLTMLTILIAVQAVVSKERLGIATSLSMFARSIGGAIGVATMGTVLASALASNLAALNLPAVDPNLMMTPESRAAIDPTTLAGLESALAGALHGVFWLGTIVAFAALVASFWLPARLQTAGPGSVERSA